MSDSAKVPVPGATRAAINAVLQMNTGIFAKSFKKSEKSSGTFLSADGRVQTGSRLFPVRAHSRRVRVAVVSCEAGYNTRANAESCVS